MTHKSNLVIEMNMKSTFSKETILKK